MLKNYKLILPTKDRGNEEVETTNSILFVGANGSGKTRLGSWIEFNSPDAARVHRISAQKSLSMPDTSTPKALDLAETDLLFGNEVHGRKNKQAFRWGDKPAIAFLSDFEKLMVYLFSDHTEESAKYLAASKLSEVRVEPPTTKLDKVRTVWERILPHRKLILGGLRVETAVAGATEKKYSSSEMSDGERVVFYLIGQCLAAPLNGIIVIDEPELHLHKSVQTPLWSEIEQLRPDCLFVYLTHDVDFAAAKESAQKIWLKGFDGTHWEWERISQNEGVPEDLLLEILGSRKPVVFVEGISGSYDSALYAAVLKDFLVIPVGSCTQVIQSVKALSSNAQLHHLNVRGLIDRDRRVPAEITKLEEKSIFVLSVAEVENLFCVKEIIELVSTLLQRDANADFLAVSESIFRRLEGELETQASLRVLSEVKFKLNLLDDKAKGSEAIKSALHDLTDGIDVDAVYAEVLTMFQQAIAARDFEKLLEIYNRKSLSSQASAALGLANGGLPELIVRLANGSHQTEIRNALKKYFGNFAIHIG